MVLGLILCGLCVLVGIGIANSYKRKFTFINDFYAFLNYVELNLNFLQDNFYELLENKKTSFNTEFNGFLQDFPESFDKRKEYILNFNNDKKLLKQEELDCFLNFFMQFGRLDCYSQLENIKQSKQLVEEIVKRTKEESAKKGDLSKKLGLMCGLAVFIIVI